jgi:hypothetical protein
MGSCQCGPPDLWRRKIQENELMRGTLKIRIAEIPDLTERETCFGKMHYVKMQICGRTVKTENFYDVDEIKGKVYEIDIDGTDHYMKMSAHTRTYLLPDYLNGNLEIPLHELLMGQGIESKMFYKHRFHHILDGNIKLFCEFVEKGSHDVATLSENVVLQTPSCRLFHTL